MGFATAWSDVQDMLAVPIVGTADTKHICLLVGIVVVAFMRWAILLGTVRGIAEEVL